MNNKKRIFIFVVTLALILVPTSIITASGGEKISSIFPNEKFASVIASKVGKSVDDEVSQDELDTITGATIVVGSSKVTDIEGIGRLSNLKGFVLAGSNITEIPKEISKLKKLAILDINGSSISAIPSEVNELSSLQTLDLAQNEITSVPDNFKNLSLLTKVDLSQNKISDYAASFPTITELNLNNNLLTSFPESILSSTSLQKLNLSSNKLENISKNLDDLSLNELDISNNKITSEVPEIALKFGKIEKWYLNNHSQVVTMKNKIIYKDQSITGIDLMPDLVKQIKEDNGGSLTGVAKWYITKPSGGVATQINAADGSELKTSDSIFSEYGEYKVELVTTNASMRYWGYSSFTTKVIKVNAEQPTIKISHDNIELQTGAEFNELLIECSEGAKVNNELADSSIISYENNTIKALKPGKTTITFNSYDDYTESERLILNVTVKDKSSIETPELTISGNPGTVKVGEKFTLIPSIDDQVKDEGWIYDNNYLSATFNSPATFTALKAGETNITYTTKTNQTVSVSVKITEDTTTESLLPSTGASVLAITSLLAIGAAFVVIRKQVIS